MIKSQVIFDFNKSNGIQNWIVVDDTVMGGVSNGNFYINADGNGEFSGNVSLENNGGFSSVRYSFTSIPIKAFNAIRIKIKGDGKKYQFRIKDKVTTYYSYILYFETKGEWETIILPLKNFYPTFRGRKLDQANFNSDSLVEIAFLIANKTNENFKLLIDSITLQ